MQIGPSRTPLADRQIGIAYLNRDTGMYTVFACEAAKQMFLNLGAEMPERERTVAAQVKEQLHRRGTFYLEGLLIEAGLKVARCDRTE